MRETELWLLDGERFPHDWVTGRFERRRCPSAARAVELFREKYPDLTQIRYHTTGDLLWYANANARRQEDGLGETSVSGADSARFKVVRLDTYADAIEGELLSADCVGGTVSYKDGTGATKTASFPPNSIALVPAKK